MLYSALFLLNRASFHFFRMWGMIPSVSTPLKSSQKQGNHFNTTEPYTRTGEIIMKENKYDNNEFFKKYSEMNRSQQGLKGAGEWETLKTILPDFHNKTVLDLGCGFGWHAAYAMEKGAASVIATDISEKMISTAKQKNPHTNIQYRCEAFEDSSFESSSFDIIIASLMLHYLESFDLFISKISNWLKPGGILIFTVEHPVFTAYGTQEWTYDAKGNILHFPIDNYFYEGKRNTTFLGESVVKYHRTLTTYLETLLQQGFSLLHVIEPKPTEQMLEEIAEMKDELRRPMMLIVSAKKGV